MLGSSRRIFIFELPRVARVLGWDLNITFNKPKSHGHSMFCFSERPTHTRKMSGFAQQVFIVDEQVQQQILNIEFAWPKH